MKENGGVPIPMRNWSSEPRKLGTPGVWLLPITPALGKPRQEDYREFKAMLGYRVSSEGNWGEGGKEGDGGWDGGQAGG